MHISSNSANIQDDIHNKHSHQSIHIRLNGPHFLVRYFIRSVTNIDLISYTHFLLLFQATTDRIILFPDPILRTPNNRKYREFHGKAVLPSSLNNQKPTAFFKRGICERSAVSIYPIVMTIAQYIFPTIIMFILVLRSAV